MAMWFGLGNRNERGGNPIVFIVMMIVAPLAAMIIQMAISRSREYGADAGGAKIIDNPLYLAEALKKLAYYNKRIPMRNANEATAHMFIVSPLSGGALLKLFLDPPSDRGEGQEARGHGLQQDGVLREFFVKMVPPFYKGGLGRIKVFIGKEADMTIRKPRPSFLDSLPRFAKRQERL